MSQVHVNIPYPKYSQALGSAERNPGTNLKLIPKYQVFPLGYAEKLHAILRKLIPITHGLTLLKDKYAILSADQPGKCIKTNPLRAFGMIVYVWKI